MSIEKTGLQLQNQEKKQIFKVDSKAKPEIQNPDP